MMEATPAAPVGKWSNYHIAELKRLHKAGLSFSNIARRLSTNELTYTRNACIGKAQRLGLSEKREPRPKVVEEVRVHRMGGPKGELWHKWRGREPAIKSLPPEIACSKVVPLNVKLFDLTKDSCRFPYGDRAPYLFCGHPQMPGCSYCAPHWALCWQPRREMREAAE